MTTVKHMAIIGAGVAGLALATFASKQGIKVTIYERNKGFSSIGAGVTLWPNATFVFQQLGLLDALTNVGGQPNAMRQFNKQDAQGREFNISALNEICGFPTVTILRSDLINVLAQRLAQLDVTVYFDQALNTEDISQLQQQFDLVVGCDGRMHSKARERLYKTPIAAQYQGFINIVGISEIDLARFSQTIHDYQDSPERFGIVPVTKRRCYWAAAWPCDLDTTRPKKAWYDEMHRRFQHWPSKVQQVLNNYQPHSLRRIFVHDLDPLPYWHSDNLVIIGDAAHAPLPTSGQGASQALEDAWHLSQLLQTERSLDEVLTTFYAIRIDKVSSAQRIGRQVAQQIFKQSSPSEQTATGISVQQLCELYMQGLQP